MTGRVALVVGAGGGIGGAVALAIAEPGACVVVASRHPDALAELVTLLEQRGATARALPVDVTDDESIARVVTETTDAFGPLTTAVNNAGAAHMPRPLAEIPLDDVDRVLQTALRGTFLAMRYELAAMADGGSIVNIASTAGLRGVASMSAYVAAKHGVVGLTRSAALDYASQRIRVNAVAPGPIASGPIMAQPAQIRQSVGAGMPLQRLGQPEEVAAAVSWLVSDAAAYVTGTVLPVDGGHGAR